VFWEICSSSYKRALYLLKRDLYLCKRALYLYKKKNDSKENGISQSKENRIPQNVNCDIGVLGVLLHLHDDVTHDE